MLILWEEEEEEPLMKVYDEEDRKSCIIQRKNRKKIQKCKYNFIYFAKNLMNDFFFKQSDYVNFYSSCLFFFERNKWKRTYGEFEYIDKATQVK